MVKQVNCIRQCSLCIKHENCGSLLKTERTKDRYSRDRTFCTRLCLDFVRKQIHNTVGGRALSRVFRAEVAKKKAERRIKECQKIIT